MTGAAEMLNDGFVDEHGAFADDRELPREKKSTGAKSVLIAASPLAGVPLGCFCIDV